MFRRANPCQMGDFKLTSSCWRHSTARFRSAALESKACKLGRSSRAAHPFENAPRLADSLDLLAAVRHQSFALCTSD